MVDFPARCDGGRAWPSRSRKQGAAFAGCKGKPEDAEMRSARRVIQACLVGESTIYSVVGGGGGAGEGGVGDALTVPLGVAEGGGVGAAALEEEVEVVLPGEADAAVDLDRRVGHPPA